MKYSVVIATYNRANDLRETLASLSALRPDGDWEVIVVDNNSTDATRGVVEGAAGHFPAPLRYVDGARAGAQPRAERGHQVGAGPNHRHDRRRCACGAGLAGSCGGRPRHARLRLRRRACVADLAWRATRVAAESRRTAMGSDRPPRLRVRTDAVWFPRAARREHGVPARRVYACGSVRSRTGRKAGTLLGQEVREWCIRRAPPTSEGCTSLTWWFATSSRPRRLNKKYFQTMVLLAGRQQGAALRAVRARHGKARRSGARPRYRPAVVRRTALPVSQGARASHRARADNAAPVMPSRHSSTSCGCVSLRASSGSGGPTAMPSLPRCGPATSLSPLDHETSVLLCDA